MTEKNENRDNWNSFGAYYVHLQETEGQESSCHHAGIGMHGCVRPRNKDLPRLVTAVRASKAMERHHLLTVTWTC